MSGLMQPIMSFIGNFGYVAICVVGAALVIDNKITMGVIASFMIYTRLFMNPLSTIAQAATQLQSAAAASERVFKFLNEKELEKEVKKTEKNPVVKLQEDIDKNIVEASKVEAVTKVPFYKRWFLLKSIYKGFKRWFIK